MSQLNKELIVNILKSITDEDTGKNIVELNFISSVVVKDNDVGIVLNADPKSLRKFELIADKCENLLKSSLNLNKVSIVLTADNNPNSISKANQNIQPSATKEYIRHKLNNVKNLIAVASGKGGVGKSSVTMGLAYSLQDLGYKIGIIDADIYGPSIPKMLSSVGEKPSISPDKKMIPIDKNGIKSISIGNLIDEATPAIWRGPMASKALFQLFQGTMWQDIDILLVDMPPGTGDIQLSLVQNFAVTGVVLVSTPQQMSVIDVQKAANMFKKAQIPILGLVENMSYFEDSRGTKNYIFGKDGGKNFAKTQNINFLGQIPIIPEICTLLDSGQKLNIEKFLPIAKNLIDKITRIESVV